MPPAGGAPQKGADKDKKKEQKKKRFGEQLLRRRIRIGHWF
jgi:hypothetical protein